jgi:hypothetical protein
VGLKTLLIVSPLLFNKKLLVFKMHLNISALSQLSMFILKLLVSIFHGLVNKKHRHGLLVIRLFSMLGKNSQLMLQIASI